MHLRVCVCTRVCVNVNALVRSAPGVYVRMCISHGCERSAVEYAGLPIFSSKGQSSGCLACTALVGRSHNMSTLGRHIFVVHSVCRHDYISSASIFFILFALATAHVFEVIL